MIETRKKVVIRVLRYEGPENWVDQTLRGSIQGGVQVSRDAKIQEIRCQGWFWGVVGWFLQRRPMARFAQMPFRSIDEAECNRLVSDTERLRSMHERLNSIERLLRSEKETPDAS